jgi:3-methyladenine DNA glycosylase AlkD
VVGVSPVAYDKAIAWSAQPQEYVKRAGFAMMAQLALRRYKTSDAALLAYLPLIEREAGDARHHVKHAVNWALRGIGKRNLALNAAAIACAERLQQQTNATAKWCAADALRELRSDAVQARLAARES